MAPVETPAHVLREFRLTITNQSQKVFGDFAGWGENRQRRLEDGTLRFTKGDLDELVKREILATDSAWYRRFETAMVGMDWPPPEREPFSLDGFTEDGAQKIRIPVKLPKVQGPFVIVLEVIGTMMLFLLLSGWSNYLPWLYPSHLEIPIEDVYLGTGSGNVPCLKRTGVLFIPDIETNPTIPFGSQMLVGVKASHECFWRIRVLADGKLIGWIGGVDPSDPDLLASQFILNTANQTIGKHKITIEFVPKITLLRRTRKQVYIYEIRERLPNEDPAKTDYRGYLEDVKITNQISELRQRIPLETDWFAIDYDYGENVFVVTMKSGTSEANVRQWLADNNYGSIPMEYFAFKTK